MPPPHEAWRQPPCSSAWWVTLHSAPPRLSLERSRDAPSAIGIRFEPVQGASVPDIAGTIWLDEGTARLRSVEYTYVNLGRRAPVEGKDARGSVGFRELPNGTWIVDD